MEHEKLFGMPVWLVAVVLGAAGVTAYLLFFRRSSSDDTPTGYSSQGLTVMANPDESATMAAQNQELSLLAQQFGDFSNTLDTGFGQVNTQLGGISNQLTGQSNQLAQLGQTIDTGFSSIGTSMNGLSGQITSGQNADQAYYQALLSSMMNYANSISSQLSASQQAELAAIQSQAQDTRNMETGQYNALYNLGTFLNTAMGQQFGGISNRLSAKGI
jgi:prophage DNA circulation protein